MNYSIADAREQMAKWNRFTSGLLVLGVVVLTGCTLGTPPAEQTPAYVGTWHVADQKDPTVLSFTEETFTFTVGDGTSVLDPIIEPEEGTEPAPSVFTKLTVTGSVTVTDESMFTLTVPEDGVNAESVEGSEAAEVAIFLVTVIVRSLSEQPMMVEIDAAGEVMTMCGSFLLILTQHNPLAALTACKSRPC